MHRGRNKPNATGRSMTSRFARLDHRLLESAAYRALSPNARALLVELTRMDNGSNNGALWLSVRDAAALSRLPERAKRGVHYRSSPGA